MFLFSYNESFSMSFLALYEGFAYYLLVNSETLDKDKVKTRPLERPLVDMIYMCTCTYLF